MVQLEDEEDRRVAWFDDVHLGYLSVHLSVTSTSKADRKKAQYHLASMLLSRYARLEGLAVHPADVFKNFNIPLQVQPQVFLVLSLVSWSQILIYNKYVTALRILIITADLN